MKGVLAVIVLLLGASAAWGEMYTWTDKSGTVFYTNSLHEIPARYLRKARVLDVATGKKGGLVTAQAAATTGAPAAPGTAPVLVSSQTGTPFAAPVASAPPIAVLASTPPAAAMPVRAAAPTEVASPGSQPRETRAHRRSHRSRNLSAREEE